MKILYKIRVCGLLEVCGMKSPDASLVFQKALVITTNLWLHGRHVNRS